VVAHGYSSYMVRIVAVVVFTQVLRVYPVARARPHPQQISTASEGIQYDGPAELPRVYLKTSLAESPAPGGVHRVSASGDLQNTLDKAKCGDTVELRAGTVFVGVFTLPAKNCDDDHWIIIRSDAPSAALPPENSRITPCYAGVSSLPSRPPFNCSSAANVMAKLVLGKGANGPLHFAEGANHYRLVGLEIARVEGGHPANHLISTDHNGMTDHIIFDRVWVHGTAQDETKGGIQLGGGTYVAIVDSYFSDFHCIAKSGACVDAHAIAGGVGPNPMGPYKITNNYLEASGENVIFGGGPAFSAPADIEIRQNHLFKPLIWMPSQTGFVGGPDGNPFIVKNLFELKNAQRVLFEANLLENSWGGFSQSGFGVLLTPKNQASGSTNVCPGCLVTDVTIRLCRISHVASGMQIGNGLSDNGGVAKDGQRYSIHDVIIDDIDATRFSGYGTLFQFGTGRKSPTLRNVRVEHITGFEPNQLFNVGSDVTNPKMSNFVFVNNIVLAGQRGIRSTGGGQQNCASRDRRGTPTTILQNCFDGFVFDHNIVIGGDSSWPKGNSFPKKPADVGFVNYNNGISGDYRLVPASRFRRSGVDGKDPGADVDAVEAAVGRAE
jgi:hypothetical protein